MINLHLFLFTGTFQADRSHGHGSRESGQEVFSHTAWSKEQGEPSAASKVNSGTS